VQVAVSRPDNQHPYDFRSPDPNAKPPPGTKAAWRIAMKEKLGTEDAKAKYKRRKCTVEPVFGIIKKRPWFHPLLTERHRKGQNRVASCNPGIQLQAPIQSQDRIANANAPLKLLRQTSFRQTASAD